MTNRRVVHTLLLAALVAGADVSAQTAEDRSRYIDENTAVSDDPRRVPMPPRPRDESSVIVLDNARLFDGTEKAVTMGSLVIVGHEIDRVLPGQTTADGVFPDAVRRFDLGGKTVLPGLIDLHTHLTYFDPKSSADRHTSESDTTLRAVERLRYYVESGITSIRDVSSAGDVPFVLKAWVRENRVAGPRIFAAGQLITSTGGHGAEGHANLLTAAGAVVTASGPDEWREAVRVQFHRGADLIKLASHYSREEIQAAVDEAHALGMRVTVDAETFYVQWAVEAGADSIEHPLPRTEETVSMMVDNKTASVPTLIPYIYIMDQSGGYYGSTSRRFSMDKDSNLAMLKTLKEAGVKLGVGTDLVVDWYRYLPAPYINELKQFVAAGLTRQEALIAATRTSAEILDMDWRLGTLEAGKLADVLVVDGRPDENLDDLANVELVIRDGTIVVRDGRLFIPRHTPEAEPDPAASGAMPWERS